MWAAKKGFTKSMNTLLSYNADIYEKDIKDWTALHYAAFNCKIEN